MSGRQPAKIIERGTILFHRVSKTNKILGYSEIAEVGNLSLDDTIKTFGIKKLGYNTKGELLDAAANWTTSFSHIIFYEKLDNLRLCNLDLNIDLSERVGINFGNPPHLPTVGKKLKYLEIVNLLDYIRSQE